ncbi:MAG: flagellar hook-basal body complex protein FliE [Bdellovibrionaceae bacterium]|nr:flagellar hook-basal body complex protein FliE [Pseudobdellovibrionaceae bacterium]
MRTLGNREQLEFSSSSTKNNNLTETGKSFGDLLSESIEKVNIHQKDADAAIEKLVSGRTKNVHETMLAVEKAEVSLKLMTQVRNKVLEAYREIMRMQV